jgi:hypothetical protein
MPPRCAKACGFFVDESSRHQALRSAQRLVELGTAPLDVLGSSVDGAEQVDRRVSIRDLPQRRRSLRKAAQRRTPASVAMRSTRTSGSEILQHRRPSHRTRHLAASCRARERHLRGGRHPPKRRLPVHSAVGVPPRHALSSDLILTLHRYWSAQGCVLLSPMTWRWGRGRSTRDRAARARPDRGRRLCPAVPPPDRRPLGENPNRLAIIISIR